MRGAILDCIYVPAAGINNSIKIRDLAGYRLNQATVQLNFL